MTNIDLIQPDGPTVVIGPVTSGKKTTKADQVRNMTDEELVFFFWGTVDGSGKTVEQWREWLKQEAE